MKKWLIPSLAVLLLLAACGAKATPPAASPTVTMTPRPTFTATLPPTATPTVTLTPTSSVPTATATPEVTPTPTPVVYTVVAGDTLSGIADKFVISIDEIMKANNLTNSTLIAVGQQLIIPASSKPNG